MTGRNVERGWKWLAGFLVTVAMVGLGAAVTDTEPGATMSTVASSIGITATRRTEAAVAASAGSSSVTTVPQMEASREEAGQIATVTATAAESRALETTMVEMAAVSADSLSVTTVPQVESPPQQAAEPAITTTAAATPDRVTSGRIAYTKARSDDSLAGIWVVNPYGANRRRLADRGWAPVWSPDGNRIVYSDGGVWVVDADGADPQLLADGGSDAVWSPDGNHVSYLRLRRSEYVVDIWVVGTDGGYPRRLARKGRQPEWSPDGRHIAYFREVESAPELWVVGADGAGLRWLTDGSGPVWSPDGNRIAYTDRRIRVVDADGANSRQLTDDYGSSLVWLPDGTYIAYSTGCYGQPEEVWVVDTVSADSWRPAEGAWSPAWSPVQRTVIRTHGHTAYSTVQVPRLVSSLPRSPLPRAALDRVTSAARVSS